MERLGLYAAGILLIIYGLIEFYPVLFLKKDKNPDFNTFAKFIFEPLENNKSMTYMLGGVFGILRIIAGTAVIMNLMWGFFLAIILCVATLTIMTFYLPAGVFDGVITGVILVILLMVFFGNKSIIVH